MIREGRTDARGTIGVLCAGVVLLARQRPWLAVVALLAIVAVLTALVVLPRDAFTRLVAAF